ncbi:MAG TPA: ABC transporter ATP-binding protein, partial [Anaeromyxobacteraceae bacterium]
GANGAGKTTTLRALSGMIGVKGEVRLGDTSIANKKAEDIVRLGVAHVPQGRGTIADLTVEENLLCATYARRRGGKAAELEKVYDYFPRLRERRTGLGGYLSGGEQQMLAIGRALVAGPDLMLLDEPSLGLSPVLVEEVFGIVERLNREEGTTILLVEQNAHMALRVASHGYVMEGGKVVLDGPVERLRQDRDVQEFYLGRRGAHRKSYREVKHYKRRKRWLS